MKECDDVAMRFQLAKLCDASSQKAVAQRFGYTPSFIHDVLTGRRAVTTDLAALMGWHRVVVFRQYRKGQQR